MIDYFFKWNSEYAAMVDAIRLANYLGVEQTNPPMIGTPELPPLTLPTPPADTAGVKFAAAAFQGAGRLQAWTQPWFNWGTFRVLPNVKAWRPSQDVFTGSPPVFDHHVYLAGWFAILAMEETLPAILNDNNLAFALNRDWTPGMSPSNLVIKNNIGAIIQDVAVSPVFAGSNYPIGGF
jgi:hypothetical protein